MSEGRGRLIVVGTGIQTVSHLSHEARSWLAVADVVFHLVPDRVGVALLERLRPGRTRPLRDCYVAGRSRRSAYDAMVARILEAVRGGQVVCAAFYGHPGVFATVPHEAIAQARAEGFEASMLPGISAEDCLFADLGVDPAADGCISYDATDFLVNRRAIDASAATVLWQIGAVGVYLHGGGLSSHDALVGVADKLAEVYPADHPVTLYEAAMVPFSDPLVTTVALHALAEAAVRVGHTLFVPAATPRIADDRYTRFRS